MNLNLYEEISDKNAEQVIGGARYTFNNKIDADISFTVTSSTGEIVQRTLAPFRNSGDTISLDILDRGEGVDVAFDSKLGEGFNPITRMVFPGTSTFDLNPSGSTTIALFAEPIIIPNALAL